MSGSKGAPSPPRTDWVLGRDPELDDLVGHLVSENPAPVPVLGGPGMGKTALSVELSPTSATAGGPPTATVRSPAPGSG